MIKLNERFFEEATFEGTSFMDGKEIAVHEYASELESIIPSESKDD